MPMAPSCDGFRTITRLAPAGVHRSTVSGIMSARDARPDAQLFVLRRDSLRDDFGAGTMEDSSVLPFGF